MSAELALVHTGQIDRFSDEKRMLLRKTLCPKDITDGEFELFEVVCIRTGLDPLAKQINAVKRGGKLCIDASIDGFRLTAARTKEYGGQEGPFWCGDDGTWKDVWLSKEPPAAAKVGVWRTGFKVPVWGIATFKSFAPYYNGRLGDMWQKMPDVMIAKCFSDDTEILTEQGFQRFPDVTARILQVDTLGLSPVEARPFAQDYHGQMIVYDTDMLNFSVTPNHDMVTTFGKVEAGAMYQTSTIRGPWRIPMTSPKRTLAAISISNDDLRLAGYIAADGTHTGYHQYRVVVSKPYKIDALQKLDPLSVNTRHSKGDISHGVREIRSNFDKLSFTFPSERVGKLMRNDKTFRAETVCQLTASQARILLDAWQEFDGHTNKKSNVRRIYSSRPDHIGTIETLAVIAGYTVSSRKSRQSDISSNDNYYLTLSDSTEQRVVAPVGDRKGIHTEPYPYRSVWCVTVPSGKIVVRRHGFSMICGNCAESQALRKAFPAELSGLYSADEMAQAGNVPNIDIPGVDTSTGEIVDEEAMKAAERAAAEREAAERAAAKAKADAEKKAANDAVAKQANIEFKERASELGYKGDIKLLARRVCKTEKPMTADLRAAINAKSPAWIAAIDEIYRDEINEPSTLDMPPTAEEVSETASAQTKKAIEA